MKTIDLNSDMGESFGNYAYGDDERVFHHITSCNLACGFHAGDPLVMQKSIQRAKLQDVRVGAHPGLPDRLGFGRRYMQISGAEVYSYVLYQLGAIHAFLKTEGMTLSHVKLHGALYMMALENVEIAEAVAQAVYRFDEGLRVYTIAGAAMHRAAESLGLAVVTEYFADRPYTEAGVKMFGFTSEEIGTPEDIAARVVELIQTGAVTGLHGTRVPIDFETICVHSDTPNAAVIMQTIRQKVEALHVPILQKR